MAVTLSSQEVAMLTGKTERTVRRWAESGKLPSETILLEQLTQFPMGAHDDGPDALEGARTIAKKVKRFRILDRAGFGI